MGCGPRYFGSDWIHIDGGDYPHLDYSSVIDLGQFKNDSVDLIYASHVLEYFNKRESHAVLCEWNRVLKHDATLRVAVPDFRVMANLYTKKEYGLASFLGPLYGQMVMGERIIYHKTCYDFKTLKTDLIESGFRDIKEYDWHTTEHSQLDDHSQAYLPHMDKKNGTLISLNVEARK